MGKEEDGESRRKVPQISDEIKSQSSRCRKQNKCLDGDQEPACRVVDCVADKIFFVEGKEPRPCSYGLTFGESRYCNCPVRQELFRKYRT